MGSPISPIVANLFMEDFISKIHSTVWNSQVHPVTKRGMHGLMM